MTAPHIYVPSPGNEDQATCSVLLGVNGAKLPAEGEVRGGSVKLAMQLDTACTNGKSK